MSLSDVNIFLVSNEWITVNIIHPAALWYHLIFLLSLVFSPLTLTFPVIHRDLLGLQAKGGINRGRIVMITVVLQHQVLLSLLVSAEKCKPRWTQLQSNTGLRWTGDHVRREPSMSNIYWHNWDISPMCKKPQASGISLLLLYIILWLSILQADFCYLDN